MRRDDDATFGELVDESFGGARAGVLDLGSLRRLLLAILTRLGIRDEPAHGSEVVARIRACEDGLAQVLKLVEDIQSQTSALKLQSEELHIRQQGELRDAGVRLEARIDALETQKADGEQMDILRRLIRDTDQRETCRHLDERVRLHEEAIERLTKECRQLDDLQRVLDRMKLTLTSDPYKQSIQSIKNFGKKSSLPADSETAAADELSGSVSASILKLKRECDELQEAIGCLRDDNKHKHVHIQKKCLAGVAFRQQHQAYVRAAGLQVPFGIPQLWRGACGFHALSATPQRVETPQPYGGASSPESK
ncbi:uncharacterized protein LOC130904645 isoform X2 [Corythoichthys intestinalis]|uniref:uncharacterized protein LOC130904645 isoform X2 n=1 Tax=Corythoichthys intestinalis TaxID=161448 RepID=UPI0025A53271|nr:uncharacterized protein LOC130904645 isoform X2 [Corythoichthys intestinalis]